MIDRETKLVRREVLSRRFVKAKSHGGHWLLELICGHTKKTSQTANGHISKKTHCEKCELGLST